MPPPGVTASYGKLPLHFEANQGQTDNQVKFLARGSGYGLFLTSTESVLVLRKPEPANRTLGARGTEGSGRDVTIPTASSPPQVLRIKLLGAGPRPAVVGKEELPGKSHYFIGNDPKKWRTNVPQYARVEYKDVYPGVSLAYYGYQRQLEYDFIVSPGGDPKQIRLGIEGADGVRVDDEGNLVLSLPGGEVVEKAPVVYQEVDGARKPVDGRFVVHARGEVGFEVGAYEANRPLVLDPVLVYSTYLAGNGADGGKSITVDVSGNAYLTGYTTSTDFPTANPFQPARGGVENAFVSKLNASGSALVYSTYLGGSNGSMFVVGDAGTSIAVDASGSAYVTGTTGSTDFPTVNPFQAANGGNGDAFVAKLDATGATLLYSTYLGGSTTDFSQGIAVDASSNAYVTGYTFSTDFPTANPIQAANASTTGHSNAFLTKLNASGSAVVYSTYFGGSGTSSGGDVGASIAVDASGNAYLTGATYSTDFPTANAFQPAYGGNGDAFVAKLNAMGTALVYSTYLGGSGIDLGFGIAVDASGNAYLTGSTFSTDFPTANPLLGLGGIVNAFVAKLNTAGSTLAYSTYLGGSVSRGFAIAVDVSGSAYVTGHTSRDFPTVNPFQPTFGGGYYDAFVVKLNSVGSKVLYSGYLGGSGDYDEGLSIAVDMSGNAYVTGDTNSTNFPTANPLQAANAGFGDAFVTKIGALADVSIAKTDGQAMARAGNAVTYTITVTNGGPDAVTGARANDAFPAALAGVTWTCSASSGSSCESASGSGNITQTVDLLVGGTATFVATGTLDIDAFGTISNTATVTASAGFTDPILVNNSATDTDTIVSLADLSITKTDGQTTATPGQPVTYTIVASNAGPTAVTWAFVSDAIPEALVAPSWTCVGAGGGICSASGAGYIYDFVNLPVGASVTYTLSATVSPTASTLSNTATITPATIVVDDPNLANNTATDTDLVTCGEVVVVVPDGRISDITVAAGATAWFGATVKVGSSYSVEFENTTGSTSPGPLTVFRGDDSCNGSSTLETHDTSMIEPSGMGGLTRASFTATGTDTFYQALLVNTTGAPLTVTFGWSETSLYSPAWSTNGSFDTYYAFQNTTGTDLGGTLTLLDATGALLTTFDVSIPAGQTVSTNTASLDVMRGRTGTAKFTHTGPPGSFVAEAAIANFRLSPAYVQPVKFQAIREAR